MSFMIRIQNDHLQMKELIEDLMGEHTSPEGKRRWFAELASLVESATRAEQGSLLAAARGQLELRPVVLERLEEQSLLEEFANKIRLTESADAWEAKVAVYCDLLGHQIQESEHQLAALSAAITPDQEVALADTYERIRSVSSLDTANYETLLAAVQSAFYEKMMFPLMNETGRIGYVIAWILGIPAWLLFVIFLIRGH